MTTDILGLHHITAVAGDVQKNVDFYVGVLGLRLVKKTVNFDDPDTYHLYYGDEVGTPGTILTFFPVGEGMRGRIGTGQATVTSFSIPTGATSYWAQRLQQLGVTYTGPTERFGDEVLTLCDPDGLALELVAHTGAESRTGWTTGPVPQAYAIRGFYGVTVSVERPEGTTRLLTEVMGFRKTGESGQRTRYEVGPGGPGAVIDVVVPSGSHRGIVSIGTVHHVAWRVESIDAMRVWQNRLALAGVQATDVQERNYFKSVYFREPGGVLFELATDPPGFAIDESIEELGTHLMLPDWLEPRRAKLESTLTSIQAPVVSATQEVDTE